MAWTEISMQEFNRRLDALPANKQTSVNGWSPGYVAARLGITRSAVYSAVRRDKLDAFRITVDGNMVSIIIPEASVLEYENSETRRKHTPKEFRATA